MKIITLNTETDQVDIYNYTGRNTADDIEEYISNTLDLSLDSIQYMLTLTGIIKLH